MSTLTAELKLHPEAACDAVRRIVFQGEFDPPTRLLKVRFELDGTTDRLQLPPRAFAKRADGLWQHTCFEVFLRPDASNSYHEFNFAPSGDWAAYRFESRRSGQSLPELPAPLNQLRVERERCALSAEIAIASLPELAAASVLHAGASAIVELDDGSISHWALAHAGGHADFHDPATFTLRIATP